MAEVSEEFRKAMNEWVELKKQLTEARKDMKVLTDREKELKTYVKTFMQETQIDTVNLKKGKATLKKTVRTPSLTKKAVEQGLTQYFSGDETRVEAAMNAIYDTLQKVESESVSLTGINKE